MASETVKEKILAAKINRSRAIGNKTNILYTKDGSDAPPIESEKEKNYSNMQLLFGKSGNENIDWDSPGVEGIIRMYYEISYQLVGTQRNNILKAGYNDGNNKSHNTTIRSGVEEAAKLLADGNGIEAGFYIGRPSLPGEINDASGQAKIDLTMAAGKGRVGEFQVKMTDGWPPLASKIGEPETSSTFRDNRDKYTYFDGNGTPPGFKSKYPDQATCIETLARDCIRIIGQRSPIGQKGMYSDESDSEILPKSWSVLLAEGHVHDSMLGYRLTDIYPETIISKQETTPAPDDGSGDSGDPGGSGDSEGGGETTTTWKEYTYGDGTYDQQQQLTSGSSGGFLGSTTFGPPSGFDESKFDYWNPALNTKLGQIKSKLDTIRFYIDKSKVSDDTYLINPAIPPGFNEAWALQNKWHQKANQIQSIVDSFLDDIAPYYSGGGTSSSSGRNYLNSRLDQFKNDLNSIISIVTTWGSIIDNNSTNGDFMVNSPIFGDEANAQTLWGLRFMAIKMILDGMDGSRTTMHGVDTAIGMMKKKLEKAEAELAMYGSPTSEWIVEPDVLGIEPYYTLNQTTYEMEVAGFIVVYLGQDHCTGYDIMKSLDYDPNTEQGTWELIMPPGQSHTVEERDGNTGKVLMYYIDYDISIDALPYYKVKAYDSGGSGEYARTPAQSLWGKPKNPEDIEAPESANISKSSQYDPKEPVKVRGTPSEIPPNTLAWTTTLNGTEANDLSRREFKSEVPFDSIASNLMVFVNEKFKNIDRPNKEGDYIMVDTYRIRFHTPVNPDDEINLHVFLRSFAPRANKSGGKSVSDTASDSCTTVPTMSDLPMPGEPDQRIFVENPPPGKMMEWVDPPGEWREVGPEDGDKMFFEDPPPGIMKEWKDPPGEWVDITPENGDIIKIENPPPSKFFEWVDPPGEWREVEDPDITADIGNSVITFDDLPIPCTPNKIRYVIEDEKWYKCDGSNWVETKDPFTEELTYWKDPVESFGKLPTLLNSDGDMRVVLDENVIYRWDGNEEKWIASSGSGGAGAWKAPVDTKQDLPQGNNIHGDLRLIVEDGSLQRWDEGKGEWEQIGSFLGGGIGTSGVWESPVDSFSNLPNPATQFNEIRLVIDEGKIYRWDANNGEWTPVYAAAKMNHDDLQDMPDQGTEDDIYHDGRYYTEDEMNSFLGDIRERINYLEELKPRDAQELSGDFTITGTKFAAGYLSGSDYLRYETLKPQDFFNYITRDVSFVLNNNNLEQFKDSDKGELTLYVNDEEVDKFYLGDNFIEDEREIGQSWTPMWGENNKINITSVKPYNNYPAYQRGDFELHFSKDDFVPGENKIQLVHTLEVDDGIEEDRSTLPFIFFFDSNIAYRGFQNVSINLVELNSDKYQSGVRFLSHDDVLQIKFTTERMFNDVYPYPKQVVVKPEDFGIEEFEINHEDENVLGSVIPLVNTQYVYQKNIKIEKNNIYNVNPRLYLQPYTVYGKDPESYFFSQNMLVNTVGSKSDNTSEYFEDEIYRLPNDEYDTPPSQIVNVWDSKKQLESGELQVYNRQLIYPQQDYSSNIPAQTINYSIFSDQAYYFRAFYSSSPKNNGRLDIDGLKFDDQNIIVHIKLPGLTGWLDLRTQYNASTFSGEDHEGCLVKVEDGYKYYFTTGQFSTADSENMIIIRVMFRSSNINTLRKSTINSIVIDWD